MKRSRGLMLGLLLLALMGIPAVWKLASTGDSDGKGKAAEALAEAGSPAAAPSSASAAHHKSSRPAVDFAAKAKSMLELRPGELGILPVPAEFLADLPNGPFAVEGGAQLRCLIHKAKARNYLEKVLREGAPAQVKIGPAGEGVGWKGEKLDLSARLNQPEAAFPELLVETLAEGVSSKISLQAACGTCAVVSYPSGESVLIVIGGALPVGGLTTEK